MEFQLFISRFELLIIRKPMVDWGPSLLDGRSMAVADIRHAPTEEKRTRTSHQNDHLFHSQLSGNGAKDHSEYDRHRS